MQVKPAAQIGLLFLFIIAALPLSGQEVLTSDADHPLVQGISPERGPAIPLRTAAALTLPFFDDFSNDSLRPAAARWLVYSIDDHVPGVSNHKGIAAPSKGVCTFDGTTFGGRKYRTDLETGINDTLTSLDVDISGNSPADSLYLSFFVQRGGGGESPEISDSLVVLFDTSGNFDYVQVWALHGGVGAEKTFGYYEIALDDPVYFHSAFRFKFISYGSLNGEFDQFHLDYVLLDAGRSAGDDAFSDVSPARILASPFAPYTTLAYEQYLSGGYTSSMRCLFSNAGNPTMIPTASFSISDPTGSNPFTGTTSSTPSAPTLPPFVKDTVTNPAFSDQAANFTTYGAIRLSVQAGAGGDAVPANNTLAVDFAVDSLMGYDDGVADFGYGLTSVKSMCQQYTLSRPDTLTALWINFSPTLHYNPTNNQSTCLDGKSFKIAVWDTLVPDSFLTQASHTVSYDSFLNDFVRYPLIRPLLMQGTFWVGLQQSDGMPIGVGWDSDCPSGYSYFEDVSGDFLPSGNKGCMMIRPEFGTNSDFVAARPSRSEETAVYDVRIAPQPWLEGPLTVELKGPEPLREVRASLISLQGREIFRQDSGPGAGIFQLDLPTGLSAGIYILRLDATTRSGKTISIRRRLPVQSAR